MLYTPTTIQERTHTHYIYKYKGREAAGVGGHAVQEITARGHPAQTHMRAKKRIMQLMRARLSVLPVVSVVPVMGAETVGTTTTAPSHASRPGSVWWQLMTPTPPTAPGCAWWHLRRTTARTTPDTHPTAPDAHRRHPRAVQSTPLTARLSLMAAQEHGTAPNHLQTAPQKIVSNAHPRVPGGTLSPGEGAPPNPA